MNESDWSTIINELDSTIINELEWVKIINKLEWVKNYNSCSPICYAI